MVSLTEFNPSTVRENSRNRHRVNLFDYQAGEGADDMPRSIISMYKYHRVRGQPKSENLTTAISWPMPTAYVEPNSLSYENYNLGLYGNDPSRIKQTISDQAKSGWDLIQQAVESGDASALADAARNAGFNAFATAPITRDTGLGRFLQIAQGVVVNPHATILFNGVPLRRFTLNWRFSPRSLVLAERLQQQIKVIKQNIYPEQTDSGFALQYPALVVVSFPNSKIEPIRKSFIENMTINNASGNSIEMYRDGTPIDYDITMSFIETEILTSDIISGKRTEGGDLGTPQQTINAAAGPTSGQQEPLP